MDGLIGGVRRAISYVRPFGFQSLSGQQFKRRGEPWTNSDGSKIARIRGENPIDAPALRYSRDRPIDQAKSEALELGIQFQGPGDIRWKRHLIFVARRRIEDLSHQFAPGLALISKEVVHFRKNETGNDNAGRPREGLFVPTQARPAPTSPSTRPTNTPQRCDVRARH